MYNTLLVFIVLKELIAKEKIELDADDERKLKV